MNRDNSETAEMLRKLMVACLTGLEADHVTRANLIIDAGYAVAVAKKTQVQPAGRRFNKLMPF
jgi:hypothetical protein